MYSVPTPEASNHRLSAAATNSGPLSERMDAGAPRWPNRRARVPITSSAVMERSTSMDRHSLVLVHHRHHLQPPPVLGAVHHEVIAPDVVLVLCPPPLAPILAGTFRQT